MEVAAPSLAGVFDVDFWLGEIPRACHADRAIWHAVVSLGAVYESFTSRVMSNVTENSQGFALRQFNLSIRCLTEGFSHGDKWQALTASVIFACICSIQDLHQEARVHIKAGSRLLRELQEDESRSQKRQSVLRHPRKEQDPHQKPSATKPVSITPLHGIITRLELHVHTLAHGRDFDSDRTLVADDESFGVWRFYQSPQSSSGQSSLRTSSDIIQYATQGNLIRANRAAEALLNGIIIFSFLHTNEIGLVITKGDTRILRTLITLQEPLARCFSELNAALRLFESETNSVISEHKPSPPNSIKPILTLTLLLAMIRPFLLQDLGPQDQTRRRAANYKAIVDLAERILQLDSDDTRIFTSSLSTTQALYFVASSGFPRCTRQRALDLLRRYPRREGLWDSELAAKLAELVMISETTIQTDTSTLPTRLTGSNLDESNYEREGTQRLYQYFSKNLSFEAERQAVVTLRTWQDWELGLEGKRCVLKW